MVFASVFLKCFANQTYSYSGSVGQTIDIYLSPEYETRYPDLLTSSPTWRVFESNWEGYQAITFNSKQSEAHVTINSFFSGEVVITCTYQIYNRSQGLMYGSAQKTNTYKISCSGGGGGVPGEGGNTPGGGDSGGGGGELQDNTFFQDTTPEGHSMWFYVYTNTYEGFKYKICIVSPGLYTTSCVSQSTVGKVTIPEQANSLNVYSIDRNSFYNIAGITEIVIPKTVQHISSLAFFNCSGLKQLTVMGEVPPNAESDSFDRVMTSNTTLYVPKGSKPRYMESIGWKNFKTIKEIGGTDVEGLDINSSNFPDENFRKYLFDQDYGKDGVITNEEINEITYMGISEDVSNLNGIENFVNLDNLSINSDKLNSLDLSKNTVLCQLMLWSKKLSSNVLESIINTLPLNVYTNRHEFIVGEEGALSSQLIAKVREQGWTPCYLEWTAYGPTYYKYPGEDPTGINLTESSIEINVGESFIMGYIMTPSSAVRDVTWSSDNSSVASVDNAGVIRGHNPGTTYINATTNNGITGSCKVIVKEATSIQNVKMITNLDASIYNLNGQRLDKPRKGINIIGGKKVIVK